MIVENICVYIALFKICAQTQGAFITNLTEYQNRKYNYFPSLIKTSIYLIKNLDFLPYFIMLLFARLNTTFDSPKLTFT